MFYFLFIAIASSLLVLSIKEHRSSSKALTHCLGAYVVTIFFLILYMAKDSYYYNIVNNYFALPKTVWKSLMFSHFGRNLIIRLLTLSCLLVIFLGCQFSLSYLNQTNSPLHKRIRILVAAALILQLIYYDPAVQYSLYVFLYPDFLSTYSINRLENILHWTTVVLNNCIIIGSILYLLYTCKRASISYFFKSYIWGEAICYTLMMVSYIMLFWYCPANLIKVSKIADYISYKTIPLLGTTLLYQIYPYYLVISTLLMGLSMLKVSLLQKKIKAKDFSIARQIDAADTTSKIFCHYMKNELLSIQMEIDMLDRTPQNEDAIHQLVERCNNLYGRLDQIHRSTKESKLVLTETNLEELLRSLLHTMQPDLIGCEVELTTDLSIPFVMLDKNYFDQAVHNLITNSIDAMKTVKHKKLSLSIQAIDEWVMLSINDTGIGIKEPDLDRIFTPLYSSQPIKKHWGIGLSLTYRIVHAHGGKIEVASKPHIGTTFKILLPNITTLME